MTKPRAPGGFVAITNLISSLAITKEGISMLNRQKALLQLVHLAGGEIDRLVLTKWAFLLRQETESRGGASFYDFVPYQYGPFSFVLYQEMEKLVSFGYVKETGASAWALGDVSSPPVDGHIQRDLVSIASRFRESSVEELLDYVYETYPAFTINSKRKQLCPLGTVGGIARLCPWRRKRGPWTDASRSRLRSRPRQ